MYLIRYELFVGDTESCASSAAGALDLISGIRADGGSVRSIEDDANEACTIFDIERRAAEERGSVAAGNRMPRGSL